MTSRGRVWAVGNGGGVPLIKVDMVFGYVESQQRPVLDGNRMGYESRKVTKNREGIVTKVGDWQPPLCWLVFPEPQPARPWWKRLFGAA
ncbi:MAG: hypothetical protein ACRC1H_19255 [Caldilineaceae bacterium]